MSLEREPLVARLRLLLNRIPRRVAVGSVQTAIAWKTAAAKANKLLEKPHPDVLKLRSAINDLEFFNGD